jgi:hypothetical protein
VVVATAVPEYRLRSILSLARQGLSLAMAFGVQSIASLIFVARTVEESVFMPRSFVRTPSGFRFALANPPLRTGGFSSLRLFVDGTALPPEHVRLRPGPDQAWRTSSSLGSDQPLELQAGTHTEFEADCSLGPKLRPVTVRLELQNVAIPPLVWLEFRQVLREAPSR